MANTFEMPLAPNSWIPDSTNPPEFGVVQTRPYWSFDDTTNEILRTLPFRMPAAYAGAGTLKADVAYIMESAVSGDVQFLVNVEAVTPGDAVDLDSAESFDAENAQADTVPATAGHLAEVTITLTNKDSVAAGDWVRLKLTRDAVDAADTATFDCRVLGVTLREEV